MNLLAIETSSPEASVALQVGGEQFQRSLTNQRKQIEQILPCIEELLAEAGLGLNALDGLVLSVGPGSFTGLRVGLGILQGISMAHDIPVASVSSLQALAQASLRLTGAERVACARNAFMDEVYYAEYHEQHGVMQVTSEDSLVSPTAITYPGAKYQMAGDAWSLYKELIKSMPESVSENIISTGEAIDVLTIAGKDAKWQAIDAVSINYLRKKDAWQRP